jgi:hypothetical protein
VYIEFEGARIEYPNVDKIFTDADNYNIIFQSFKEGSAIYALV